MLLIFDLKRISNKPFHFRWLKLKSYKARDDSSNLLLDISSFNHLKWESFSEKMLFEFDLPNFKKPFHFRWLILKHYWDNNDSSNFYLDSVSFNHLKWKGFSEKMLLAMDLKLISKSLSILNGWKFQHWWVRKDSSNFFLNSVQPCKMKQFST